MYILWCLLLWLATG